MSGGDFDYNVIMPFYCFGHKYSVVILFSFLIKAMQIYLLAIDLAYMYQCNYITISPMI